MRVIELSRGMAAMVDDADFEYLAQYRWCYMTCGYAGRNRQRDENGKRQGMEYMHRAIMGAKKGQIVDHRNMNTLDNRRCNLRLADKSENQSNSKAHKDNKLGVKGVHVNKGKYVASIMKNGKQTKLGRFTTVEEAMQVYAEAAKELHGEFARVN